MARFLVGGSVVAGIALGAAIAFYAVVGPAPGAVRVGPDRAMVDEMTDWGQTRGASYIAAECYAARPVTACVVTYISPTRTGYVPWIFIDGPSGRRSY